MNLRASLLGLALVTLLAACGSDDDGGTPTPVPTLTRPATPTGPTAVPGPGVNAERILLGMTNDLSGSGNTPYGDITVAIQTYFAKVNQEDGGVCGRDVALYSTDDAYAPHLALEQTRFLVEQQQVLAMIGALSTDAHEEVAAYLNDPNADGDTTDGVPDLFVSTGWSAWSDTSIYPWTIPLIPSYTTDAAVLGRYARETLGEDALIALLYEADETGREYVRGLLEEIGEENVITEPVTASVRVNVESVADSGAAAVISALTPDLTAWAIRSAAAVDFNPLWLISNTNTPGAVAAELGDGDSPDDLTEGFAQLAGAATTAYLLSPVQHADVPAMFEHSRIMRQYDGPPPSTLTVYGHALAETAVETLARACHDLTRPGVMRAAESLTGYRPSLMLPNITLTVDANDHDTVDTLQPVEITELGELLPLGDPISP